MKLSKYFLPGLDQLRRTDEVGNSFIGGVDDVAGLFMTEEQALSQSLF